MSPVNLDNDSIRSDAQSAVDAHTLAPSSDELADDVFTDRPSPGSIVLRATAGLLALISGLATAGIVLTSDPLTRLQRWDESISEHLAEGRSGEWVDVARFVTRLGDTMAILALIVAITAVLALGRRWRAMIFVPLAMLVELSAFLVVNHIVGRDRPDVPKIGPIPHTFSYPSGHVAATWVCWIGAALLATALAPQWLARIIAAIGAAMTLLMAWARVYLGMHYTIDVVVGWLMGIGALIVSVRAISVRYRVRSASLQP